MEDLIMKFILKNYVKQLYDKQNKNNFTLKQIAKYNLRKQDKLYNFDIYLDGVYFDNINVYLTNERNRALNRSRGYDWSYSANKMCLHENQCSYYVYNEKNNIGAFRN